MRPTRTIRLIVAAVLLTAAGLAAAPEEKVTPRKATELLETVRLTKEEFTKLIGKFYEVADLLEKGEPETAKVLREAANQARRALIADNMDDVMEHIEKGLMTMAAQQGKGVKESLEEILRILRQGSLDLDKRVKRLADWNKTRQDIDKLLAKQRELEKDSRLKSSREFDKKMQAHADKLNSIISEQKGLLDKAQKLPGGAESAKKLADLRKSVRALITKQEKLQGVTRRAPLAKLPLVAPSQTKLAGEADKAKSDLDAAAKDPKLAEALKKAGADPKALASAAGKVARAAGEMKKASEGMADSDPSRSDKHQKNALADLKAAEKELTDAMAKAAAKTPSGKLGKQQDALGDKTSQLGKDIQKTADDSGVEAKTGNMERASGEMTKAGEKLTDQEPKASTGNMKKALDELQQKKDQLADLRRRTKKKAEEPTEKQAGR